MSKANTTILDLNGYEVFYSYATPVAAVRGQNVYVTMEQYSPTTSKQLNKYLKTVGDRQIVQVPAKWFEDAGFNCMEGTRL